MAVVVYLQLCGQWWGAKPTTREPLTPLGPDGRWRTDVTTGGNDPKAARYAVFVVPRDFVPPAVVGEPRFPGEFWEAALLETQVRRPDCDCNR